MAIIMEILRKYESASGQAINLDKTGLFFSPNTTHYDKERFLSTFRIKEAKNMKRYLDLPAIVGRSKKKAFDFLSNRIEKVISGWSKRQLSKGGRKS